MNEDIVFFAFRYVLHRSTGAVGMVIDYLIEHWSEISINTQNQIKREIIEEFNAPWSGGMKDYIKQDWQRILDL